MGDIGLRIEETEGRGRIWWKGVEVEKEERELKKEVEKEKKLSRNGEERWRIRIH